ncbi:transmembrane protein 68 isoform X5 [Acinonyx jubatus]|uniref:Transmembrane protein 68 isoform X5 n=1 Tax=Acinonyx jubatus TaxID=32536 RepID=A0ABM3NYM3_ACIJB|nr:transmembrane protein 68 isoform X5 [Acinonyx jubatus]
MVWCGAVGGLFEFCKLSLRKNVLKEAYSHNLWDGARKTVATLWDGHAAVWHGYEVHGMEKIPEEGPALIIFYHGAIPIDFYYFMAKIFIHKGRTCRVVADHFVFKIPGFSLLLDVFCALHGPREKCVEILRSGHLLAISPGGVREALISDETYNIIWGNRKGFAQVAIDAKVPIIPMFTQNIREGFRSLGGTRLFRWLYEKFRYPFAPMYGGFPVKLRTYLGEPIPYDPKITAEELAEKVRDRRLRTDGRTGKNTRGACGGRQPKLWRRGEKSICVREASRRGCLHNRNDR